jgi:DNA-binding PadR family transcriptional regulator
VLEQPSTLPYPQNENIDLKKKFAGKKSMSKISNTEIAVLGILYEHHHYPNRLEEIMEKRGMSSWAELEYSSIDELLNILEEKKLVKSLIREEDLEDGIKLYEITQNGTNVLKNEVTGLLSQRHKIKSPMDLGLANMNILSHDELIQSLNSYLISLDKQIKFIDESIKVQEENKVPANFIAILSRSIALLNAEKLWLEEFLEKSRNK